MEPRKHLKIRMTGLVFVFVAVVQFLGGLLAAWLILGPSESSAMPLLVAPGLVALLLSGGLLARIALRYWRDCALSRS